MDDIGYVYENGGTKTGTIDFQGRDDYLQIYTTYCVNSIGTLYLDGLIDGDRIICDSTYANYNVRFWFGYGCLEPISPPTAGCGVESFCGIQYDKKTGGLNKKYTISKTTDNTAVGITLDKSSLDPLEEAAINLLRDIRAVDKYGKDYAAGTIDLKSGQWVVIRNSADKFSEIVEVYTNLDTDLTEIFDDGTSLDFVRVGKNILMDCDNENTPDSTWENNEEICFMGGYSNDVSVAYTIKKDTTSGITTMTVGVYDACLDNEKGGTDLICDSQCDFSDGQKCDCGSECSTGLCIDGTCRSSCTSYDTELCSHDEIIWNKNIDACSAGTCKAKGEVAGDKVWGGIQGL